MLQTLFSLRQFQQNTVFSYIILRLSYTRSLILELGRDFLIVLLEYSHENTSYY